MPCSWPLRWLALFAAGLILSLMIAARGLVPAEQGYGTHQQLGLPPCTSVTLFDVTCPACGMTTAWAWATRGEITQALQANAGGTLLLLIALAYLPLSCYFFCGGQTSPRGEWSLLFGIGILAALVIAALQWILRLHP